MILKIINNVNNEKSWVVDSILNSYQVVEGKGNKLYNFWFDFKSSEVAKDVLHHILHSDQSHDNRPIKVTVVDDSGNESENLLPVIDDSMFKAVLSEGNDNGLYMELRDRFKEMDVYTSNK